MVIGITGRIATGKTTIAGIFESHGYFRIDADKIYSSLLNTSADMRKELEVEFGSADKSVIYGRIKNSPVKLDVLNEITHKYVVGKIEEILDSVKESNVVLDVPIPIKRGFLDLCEYIIVADCSREIQISRQMTRNSLNAKNAKERVDMQKQRRYYTRLADYVINTDNMEVKDLEILIEKFINI